MADDKRSQAKQILEAAFDGVAENYDHHIMDNEMNLWLRNRSVWQYP